MKYCLPFCALLMACTPEKRVAETVSPPAAMDPIQKASARVDAALIHDYELVKEQRAKWKNTPDLPSLPGLADDSTFLRRVCIDIAGRLPRPDEVRAFLANTSSDKRARLTDALVREPGAAEVRFRMLAEAFRIKDGDESIDWLRQAAAEDRPYTEIITHMIGGGHMRQRDQGDALRTSVETAYTVLGEDLYCAMCHDHPFNDHTERECYSFAACFAGKNEMRFPSDYLYRDGKPGEVVAPALLRLSRHWHYLTDREDHLTQVAKWIVNDEDSRRYALVAALRIWNSLFGMPGQMVDKTIGGVDDAPPWHGIHRKPVLNHISNDCFSASPRGAPTWIDMNVNSPADFSQGIKVLIEEFLRCDSRLGEFQRMLARTDAYRRSGFDYNTDWNDCYLVPAPQIRRLPSEVIWRAVSGEVDAQIPQVPPVGHPLRMLGRGTREWTDESLTPISHELVRFMMNDKLVETATARRGSADDLFLELLGREASERERAAISHHAASSRDIAWALLNTTEFMFRP
ncbi:DUF1549 domain-containing protein [Prosthecobacter sp.]|uniref:DUF1549 domain-containing protein n=1 Tax=Prosthecobacter sp. TaxID=1965333 RepID=UPI001DC8510B|nr:DUF1549 domain-containing protein [Prosthecobacter sp.]MCB1275777.1 DUF1549 domain-containing protein [Prosthecobacter sp.]